MLSASCIRTLRCLRCKSIVGQNKFCRLQERAVSILKSCANSCFRCLLHERCSAAEIAGSVNAFSCLLHGMLLLQIAEAFAPSAARAARSLLLQRLLLSLDETSCCKLCQRLHLQMQDLSSRTSSAARLRSVYAFGCLCAAKRLLPASCCCR